MVLIIHYYNIKDEILKFIIINGHFLLLLKNLRTYYNKAQNQNF